MAELILIRHSLTLPQADVNSHEWELNAEGKEKCKILAEKLRPYAIAHIYTSSETKAITTGQIVAKILEKPWEIATDLAETRREGIDFVANQADFKAQVREAMQHPNEILFGEESFTKARERFLAATESLLAKHPQETIALVSHGRVLSMVLAYLTGDNPSEIWDSLKMPAYAVLSLPEKKLLSLVRSIVEEE